MQYRHLLVFKEREQFPPVGRLPSLPVSSGSALAKRKSLELFALNGDDIIFPDNAPLSRLTLLKRKVLSALPVSGWS